jgi:hypothetical protein
MSHQLMRTEATEAKAFSAESCNGCHAGAASVIFVGLSMSVIAAEESFLPYVDEQGNISFPDGFRTSMVHLGSWFVPEGGANVSYATDGLKQWFVMIKDEKGRFEDNPIWGDGWG